MEHYNVIDRDWVCERVRRDVVEFCPLNVYKTACSTAVDEGLCASSDRHVRRLYLYVHCKGHGSGAGCYYIFDR
jgi:hypothetical protein